MMAVAGRVPVFDGDLQVLGYEYFALAADGRQSRVPLPESVVASNGLDALVGSKSIWMDASAALVAGNSGDDGSHLPADRTVLVVGDGLAADGGALESCRQLSDQGYKFAVRVSMDPDEAGDALDIASFALVDRDLSRMVRMGLLAKLAEAGAVPVVAGIEDRRQMEEWALLGVSNFHGHLLSHPGPTGNAPLSPSRVACLQLLNRIRDPDSDAAELETVISGDIALSYRLLHISGLGSSGGLRRPVSSLKEAVVLLGRDRLYGWLTLMVMADMNPLSNDQATIALIRARMCELMAADLQARSRDAAFTVGLISGLALIVGTPVTEIIPNLRISDELAAALLDGSGVLGAILADVLEWETAASVPELRSGMGPEAISGTYLSAVSWASEVSLAVEQAP
jgi:EAL and modified HD-GYP domain-containing signal transduction protein